MTAVADGFSSLGTLVFVAGALGVAAMGLADSLKLFACVGRSGFGELFVGARPVRTWLGLLPAPEQGQLLLGGTIVGRTKVEKALPIGGALLEPLASAYDVAYGADWRQVLEGAWRSGRSNGELPRLLRQGARLGVSELAKGASGAGNLRKICDALRFGSPDVLAAAYGKLVTKVQLLDADREAIGRFEALVDARIDAALGLAETRYQRLLQLLAAAIALALAFLMAVSWPPAASVDRPEADTAGGILADPMLFMLFAGVLAIPLAPTFKNIASALDEAVSRLRGGK